MGPALCGEMQGVQEAPDLAGEVRMKVSQRRAKEKKRKMLEAKGRRATKAEKRC
jgi:hypothetical protein